MANYKSKARVIRTESENSYDIDIGDGPLGCATVIRDGPGKLKSIHLHEDRDKFSSTDINMRSIRMIAALVNEGMFDTEEEVFTMAIKNRK